jgi:hypothetical protein
MRFTCMGVRLGKKMVKAGGNEKKKGGGRRD